MLSQDALAVLTARYLQADETPDGMFQRVADYVARAENLYGGNVMQAAENYYQMMSNLYFLPNSPTLMNAGKRRSQLAACFVLPIEDSLESIFESLKHAAIIQQSGGGTGFSFSRIRGKNDLIAATGGRASGPVAFLHIYDLATQLVRQGAVRSGANMAVLRVDHPDIEEFITVKRQHNVLNNFNLSVAVTDKFMQAVYLGGDFDLINPRTGQTVRTVAARQIFSLLAGLAWESGEPGIFFLDTVNKANPTPQLGCFEAPNPCSEQPLLPYESCVLGSINLVKMIAYDQGKPVVDYKKIAVVAKQAIRFLDSVIDVNDYPLPVVAETTKLTRKVGLGIMGLAELFIILGIPYASQEAVRLTAQIMKCITAEARSASRELAGQRGEFPAFKGSRYDYKGAAPLRNATVTTIAPTGSISIIADCSGGIEPLFALAASKKVLENQVLTSINDKALRYLDDNGLLSDEIYRTIASTGSIATTDLPENVKQVLATAHEIKPYWHVAILAAAQKYTDNAVSKTVNLANSATVQDVAAVFVQAFAKGCKGITVYRDSSRINQVLNHGTGCCLTCCPDS